MAARTRQTACAGAALPHHWRRPPDRRLPLPLYHACATTQPAGKVVEAARDRGLIVITAGAGDIVRLVPPLIVTEQEIDEAAQVLGEAVAQALA